MEEPVVTIYEEEAETYHDHPPAMMTPFPPYLFRCRTKLRHGYDYKHPRTKSTKTRGNPRKLPHRMRRARK